MELTHDHIWPLFFALMVCVEGMIITATIHSWNRADSYQKGLLVILAGVIYTAVVLLVTILVVLHAR